PDGSPPVGGWLADDPSPTTTLAPVPPPVSPPEPPPPAAAGEPRRPRVTVRSVLFVVAIVAILGIAFGGITYYGRSGYYVGFVGDQVAVFKGQHGGLAAEPRPHDQLHVASGRRRLVRDPALQPRRRHPGDHHHADSHHHRRRRHHHDGGADGSERPVIASARRSTELGLVLMAAL